MTRARIAEISYLITFLTGSSALFVGGRLGSAVNIIAASSYVVVTILFYGLFKPVDRHLSLVAAMAHPPRLMEAATREG